MFSIQFDHTVDVDVCVTDVIGNLRSFSRSDLMELKGEVENELGGVTVPILEKGDDTIENSEKVQFLLDNIWDINLDDLKNLKK